MFPLCVYLLMNWKLRPTSQVKIADVFLVAAQLLQRLVLGRAGCQGYRDTPGIQ